MFDVAFKNLWARKTRSSLCILGVMVCVFLINTVDGMLSNMRAGMTADLARYMGKIVLQQAGAGYPPFASSLDEQAVEAALARDDLNHAESAPLLFLVIEPAQNPMEYTRVIGIPPGKERAYLAGAKVMAGAGTLVGEAENAAILGAEAATFYKAEVGHSIATIPAAHFQAWAYILSVQEVIKVSVLVGLAGVLAALYPAWRATQVDPLESLRYE